MKKGKYIAFVLLTLLSVNKVNAECDYKRQLEINTKAANISAKVESEDIVIDREGNVYEDYDGPFNDDNGIITTPSFSLNISNIDEEMYVILTNEKENVREEIHGKDLEDGTFSYALPAPTEIRTYNVEVYTEDIECQVEKLRTIEVKSPMYNEVSGSIICRDNNAYYCQEYVTTEINIDPYQYMENNDNETELENNDENKKSNFMMYVYTAGIGVVILLVIGIIIVLIIRKRRKEKLIMGVRL